MNDQKWLCCHVAQGQFSGEYAISGKTFDGEGFSIFAPDEFISIDQGNVSTGFVQVEEIDRDGNLVLIKLPRSTLENGATITVSASELELHPTKQEA